MQIVARPDDLGRTRSCRSRRSPRRVTVTGASPVVDVTTTKVGTSLKGDALIAVPNSTDVWGALSEAPGIRMQGFDVGGSHKSQQSGYESFGVQNQARVDLRRRRSHGRRRRHRLLRGLFTPTKKCR